MVNLQMRRQDAVRNRAAARQIAIDEMKKMIYICIKRLCMFSRRYMGQIILIVRLCGGIWKAFPVNEALADPLIGRIFL